MCIYLSIYTYIYTVLYIYIYIHIHIYIYTRSWPGTGGLIQADDIGEPVTEGVDDAHAGRRSVNPKVAENQGADASRFPEFGGATAFEALVGPGEMLYIPSYWYVGCWRVCVCVYVCMHAAHFHHLSDACVCVCVCVCVCMHV